MNYNIGIIRVNYIMPPKKSTSTSTSKPIVVKPTSTARRLGKLKKIENIDDGEVDFTIDDETAAENIDNVEGLEDADELETLENLESDEKVPELTSIQPLKERYEYHPVLRTEIVFVAPENRITSEILTKFEFTEIISHRAKQMENGGVCYTDVGELTDPLEMAKKELMDKKCPLDLIRGITDKIFERWHVNEMGYNAD